MERRPSSALRKALTFLETETARTLPGAFLPPVTELAKSAAVAYVTMWKALSLMKRKGLLRARPRRGIEVIRHTGPAQDPAPRNSSPMGHDTSAQPGQKWQRTCIAMRRDLLMGYYAPAAPLPSAKELTGRYGICLATLSKALHGLVEEGALIHQRARFFPAVTPPRHTQSTVLLVAGGTPDGTINLPHARTPEYMRALEYACSLRNVSLSFLPYDTGNGRLHDTGAIHRFQTDLQLRSCLLGVMIWQAGIDQFDWTDIIREFAPLGRPIAALDENGEIPIPAIPGSGRRIRHYGLGYSTEAGGALGRYLLAQGHRRVAFISPLHRSAWSRNRLEGLRMAFEAAGETNAVQQFVLEQFALPSDISTRSAHLEELLCNQLKAPFAAHDELACLGTRAVSALRREIRPVLTRQAYAVSMLPLMEAAIGEQTITAWVAADDDTALPCLEYLREKGRRVPEDISVVGFDDSFDSSIRKLTSYNYNGAAYMRAMLAHVLSPGCAESGGIHAETVEINGAVVPRRTSGPARPTRGTGIVHG